MNTPSTVSPLWKYLTYLALFIGVALRLLVYLDNRNLFQDEADIARNIYERDFIHLLLPLSYHQYAPPLFLWGLKCITGLWGYSEYVFRLISLVSSIGSLLILYLILKKFGVKIAIWYPLFMFSTGFIYIRYATELKQYSFDTLIALGLIYLALSIDFDKVKAIRFVSLWAIAGSFAIWSSMPSVFVLAGIGLYYFTLFLTSVSAKKIFSLGLITGIWFIQFLLYYLMILKPQIESEYLQAFHKGNFLILLPQDIDDLRYNWAIFLNLFEAASGYGYLAIKFHLILIVVAIYFAFRNRNNSIFLLITPIVLLLLAALLHQYALTPRIVLFIMPILLLLIGIGFEQVLSYRYIQAIALCISFICICQFSELKYFYQPLRVVQITDSMDFLVRESITAPQLYIHPLAVPAFRYYTEINPGRNRWITLKNARQLDYNGFDTTAPASHIKTAIIYGSANTKEVNHHQVQIQNHLITIKQYSSDMCRTYIYSSK